MRISLAIVALMLGSGPVLAATIAPEEAAAHVGETVTVEGTASVFVDPGSGNVFIDMGAAYPDNAFTAIVFSDDADAFSGLKALSGRQVDVTGPITLRKGRPEIVVKSPSQIR